MSEPVPTHVLPETSSDERMHELSDACWCHPLNEFIPHGRGPNEWRITHKADPEGEQHVHEFLPAWHEAVGDYGICACGEEQR